MSLAEMPRTYGMQPDCPVPAFGVVQPAHEARTAAAEYATKPEGREALDLYFDARQRAELVKHDLDPAVLETIQGDAQAWLQRHEPGLFEPGTVEDYANYDENRVSARLNGLMAHLMRNHRGHITTAEVVSTSTFVNSAFRMWEAKDAGAEQNICDGTFAFVVPPRVSRQHPEYGDELADLAHVIRYVPRNLRAAMLRGMPPWVVDAYLADENGKRGYLMCASVTGDMEADLSVGDAVKTARNMVNDAVDLAADGLGVWAIGYGATFPRLMRYGTETRRDDVVTTTGHAGTIVQITNAVDKLHPEREELKRLGVVGLGAIGAPAAEVLAQLYPGAQVTVFDDVKRNMAKLAERNPGRFTEADSTKTLIEESDVIISAVTRRVELRKLGVTDMKGKLVVDDSQPACFDAEEVAALGGVDAWPIGTDHNSRVVRQYCGYGDLMVNRLTDLFGCEAEVATLVLERARLEAMGVDPRMALRIVGGMAIRGPVTAQDVHRTRQLFRVHGIGASELQSFGVRRGSGNEHHPTPPTPAGSAGSPGGVRGYARLGTDSRAA